MSCYIHTVTHLPSFIAYHIFEAIILQVICTCYLFSKPSNGIAAICHLSLHLSVLNPYSTVQVTAAIVQFNSQQSVTNDFNSNVSVCQCYDSTIAKHADPGYKGERISSWRSFSRRSEACHYSTKTLETDVQF